MRSRRSTWPPTGAGRPEPVLSLPGSALAAGQSSALSLLEDRLALHYQQLLPAAECAALTRSIYSGRGDWTTNFDGVQFTLGRAYYVDLEMERESLYFASAAQSDATVERWAPGLAARLAAVMSDLVQAQVVQRPGFCGAGVHIFPAGGDCAQQGGDLHFDNEGLSDDQLAHGCPALTVVLMLAPAHSGGGLRLWDCLYEGSDPDPAAPLPQTTALCSYQAGDLVVLSSYRLHQIMPFAGSQDRISATLHAVLDPETERWEVWF
jgi:hypothetical protein